MPDQPKKIRVGILFGGRSAEHEVSLQSARNVFEALDKEKYEPVLIGIGKDGSWHLSDSSRLLQCGDPRLAKLTPSGLEENSNLALLPWKSDQQWLALDERRPLASLDVVFPVLHGPLGEDGTIQGLLRLAGLPFVGAGVLGSALGMDKDVMKRLLRDAGIPSGRFRVVRRAEAAKIAAGHLADELGLPLFVKPANMGSSVGIHKVHRLEELLPAIQDALRYDHKVLVEDFIEGREIECSV
ncbi:MAG: D-alanine--D-alanine ligase family protein, partial [Acidobacteriota bacterium]